jgi:hypothetical protein
MFPNATFPIQNDRSKWHVWIQWHQTNPNACCVPDLQFVLHKEMLGLWVIQNQSHSKVLWNDRIKLDHWYEFNLFVKWSRQSDKGFVELWVDGLNVLPKTYHHTLDRDSAPYSVYMKQGLYRDSRIDQEQSINLS